MFPCNSGLHHTLVGEGLAVESTLHPLDITQKDLLITLDNLLDITMVLRDHSLKAPLDITLEDPHIFLHLTPHTIHVIPDETVIHPTIRHPTTRPITNHPIILVRLTMAPHLCTCIATLPHPHPTIT